MQPWPHIFTEDSVHVPNGWNASLLPGECWEYLLYVKSQQCQLLKIVQGGPKKPDCFSDLITLWRLVQERCAVCQNFRNFIEKKVQNSHFNEFKYSLPNLLKSSTAEIMLYMTGARGFYSIYTNIQWNNCHFPTELVQTKLHVGTLCLDDHHQSFWQLIDHSIQCVLT